MMSKIKQFLVRKLIKKYTQSLQMTNEDSWIRFIIVTTKFYLYTHSIPSIIRLYFSKSTQEVFNHHYTVAMTLDPYFYPAPTDPLEELDKDPKNTNR